MKRVFIIVCLFLLATFSFAQQNTGSLRIIGGIPDARESRPYQIQVGAFKVMQNAERAFERLSRASLNPVYEQYLDFTRVMIRGIGAGEVPLYLERIRNIGFPEIIIRVDTARPPVTTPVITPIITPVTDLPVSTAALPSTELKEIGYRTIKTGETRSLADLASGRNIVSWTSSTPSASRVDSAGNVTGVNVGNAYININQNEYISVVVVPAEDFYIVPESDAALLPPESKTGQPLTENLTEYRTEPTFRLAYRFNNKGEYKGASGENGGIDILGRGADYEWLWTSYEQGGWFYDLNGVKRKMINGYQKDAANGVELTVLPEFVYDKGVPYLQLRHLLHNTNTTPVSEQRFGASADVMIHRNDHASLVHTAYGAYMTDSATRPSLELMFICESGDGIDPVDTLWLGTWDGGDHLYYIFNDRRSDVHISDSAIGFSYQGISLAPGETKEYVVRFTLARKED